MSEDNTASPPRSPLEERLSRIRQELAAHQAKGRPVPPVLAPAQLGDQTLQPESAAQDRTAPNALDHSVQSPPLPAKAAPPAAAIGAGVHPAANLARLARRLQPGAAETAFDDASGPVPGPEGMADIAGRLGLSVSMESRRPMALIAADCPAC